jgi:hypothetical protein
MFIFENTQVLLCTGPYILYRAGLYKAMVNIQPGAETSNLTQPHTSVEVPQRRKGRTILLSEFHKINNCKTFKK